MYVIYIKSSKRFCHAFQLGLYSIMEIINFIENPTGKYVVTVFQLI